MRRLTSKPRPLYSQLVDILRNVIETELQPGMPLPPERELSEKYELSRTTVRMALKELETLGLIERQHGRGTFVIDRSRSTSNLSSAYSFVEQMRELGREPQTKVLSFELIPANHNIARALHIDVGEKVYHIVRLRLADGEPMMVDYSYLPYHLLRTLTGEKISKRPLYEILSDEYHQKLLSADEEFSASIAGAEEARMLGIAENAPVLRMVRTTYNIYRRVIEFTRSVARADKFTYKISHKRNS